MNNRSSRPAESPSAISKPSQDVSIAGYYPVPIKIGEVSLCSLQLYRAAAPRKPGRREPSNNLRWPMLQHPVKTSTHTHRRHTIDSGIPHRQTPFQAQSNGHQGGLDDAAFHTLIQQFAFRWITHFFCRIYQHAGYIPAAHCLQRSQFAYQIVKVGLQIKNTVDAHSIQERLHFFRATWQRIVKFINCADYCIFPLFMLLHAYAPTLMVLIQMSVCDLFTSSLFFFSCCYLTRFQRKLQNGGGRSQTQFLPFSLAF